MLGSCDEIEVWGGSSQCEGSDRADGNIKMQLKLNLWPIITMCSTKSSCTRVLIVQKSRIST